MNFDELFFVLNNFYSSSIPSKQTPKYIILQNNRCKIYWDIFITLTLFFLTIVVPIRLAFTDSDPPGWIAVYTITDISFLIDIVLTFNTSYEDELTYQEITDRKLIVKRYLKGWFWFDALSIFPADYILQTFDFEGAQLNSLFRFAKFAKVYKIVRLLRLARIVKLLKKNKSLFSRLSEKLSLSTGIERLLTFTAFMLIFVHVWSCVFILID